MTRLRQELEDAGVTMPPGDESGLLREIDRARFPRRHERRFPPYGAFVSVGDANATSDALDELGVTRMAAPRDAARHVRRMADGVQSFSFVRDGEIELIMLPAPVGREIELVRLRRALGPDTALVCRSEDGIVRIFGRRQIVIFDGTRWWTKPDAHEYTISVRRSVRRAPPELTQNILDFCVHSAGPGVAGTMLVWCLDDDAVDQLRRRSVPTQQPLPIRLPLTVPVAHSSICHLLFQVDGAGLVDPGGSLVEVGLHLRASAEAHQMVDVPADRGTRHAAAKRCSHDIRDAVFFVVSEDGPVTVYAGGHVVASIDITADGEEANAVG
jgi:hypothetical protein